MHFNEGPDRDWKAKEQNRLSSIIQQVIWNVYAASYTVRF